MSFKILILAAALALHTSCALAQGSPGGFECLSAVADPYEIRAAGLRWTLNGEPRSEAEARENVRSSCRAAKGWSDPFGSACRKMAESATCSPMRMFHCSGQAMVRDRWERSEGSKRNALRLGVVYVPESEAEAPRARIPPSFAEFCSYAQKKNLFGIMPAIGDEEFCQEALTSLSCR